MRLRLDSLSGVPFSDIVHAFNRAFADYHVQMGPVSETWLRHRLIKNAVDYDASVGVFDGDQLVGFSLTAVDEWLGERAAYDAATGLVPEYRGQQLARRMFDAVRALVVERKARRFLLEVLQVNEPAIRAYRKVGFEVTRGLDSFELAVKDASLAEPQGTPGAIHDRGVTIREVGKEVVLQLADQLDWQPSWENSLASIQRFRATVLTLAAMSSDEVLGALVYSPLLNWVMNLVVRRDTRRRGIGTRLLSELRRRLPAGGARVKIVNVAHEDRGMIAFLRATGCRPSVSQYEMEMILGKYA